MLRSLVTSLLCGYVYEDSIQKHQIKNWRRVVCQNLSDLPKIMLAQRSDDFATIIFYITLHFIFSWFSWNFLIKSCTQLIAHNLPKIHKFAHEQKTSPLTKNNLISLSFYYSQKYLSLHVTKNRNGIVIYALYASHVYRDRILIFRMRVWNLSTQTRAKN